jgi:HNH endonuclease
MRLSQTPPASRVRPEGVSHAVHEAPGGWVLPESNAKNGAYMALLILDLYSKRREGGAPSTVMTIGQLAHYCRASETTIHSAIKRLTELEELIVEPAPPGLYGQRFTVIPPFCYQPYPAGPRRKPIPFAVRLLVYGRDGYACVSCGATHGLTIDHIHPHLLGGSDNPENLQTMCKPCNIRKGARAQAASG